MEFFAAGGYHEPFQSCPAECDGSPHDERLFLAANRVGKTEGAGGYEVCVHCTGRYPHWWTGVRFEHPIECWAAGKTMETTRDIIQRKLFGDVVKRGTQKGMSGTGIIPGEDIGTINWRRGSDLIDTVRIRNKFGGWSLIGLKTYEQGRGNFEGTEKHLVWFDEEPPLNVYVEAKMRLMTTNGHALLTFTPLEGMSEVVLAFLPGGSLPGAGVV